MRSLRFWQKTYLLTLVVVLAALCGGLAFVGWQNQQQTLESQVEKAKGEQLFIARNLARDLTALDQSNVRLHAAALARSYGSYYAREDAFLEVSREGDVLFSNLPGQPETTPVGQGEQAWTRQALGDIEAVVVSSALPGEAGDYLLSYAVSLEPLRSAWDRMRLTLLAGSAVVSLALAVALFFVLRSLSRPLERLAGSADEFAAGNLSARAVQTGTDEVGMLAASFNDMADTAERDIREIGRIAEANARMAASLSHEIRTPLTAIRGYAEYLQLADADAEERASALGYIVQESERLQAVSQRMLQLFSLEADCIDPRPVDLAAVARRALRTVDAAAHAGGVHLQANLPDSSPIMVLGDAVLLESLVTNLLDNAVAACSEGGRVKLDVQSVPGGARLGVSDDGRGLSPDELERLGEPFYRPDRARSRAHGGAGLGVALSLRIAHAHGATLRFASQEGEGTVVETVLPVRDNPVPRP